MVGPPLPPMLGKSRICERCYAKATCAVAHRALEGGTAASSGMEPDNFEQVTSTLSPTASEFFAKWLRLV